MEDPTLIPAGVLIVEDSATQAQQLRHILESHGYRVAEAGNGRLALAAVRQFRPSLIISDVVMPEMDGYELCRAIKARAELRGIPFILVTTLSDPQDVIRGLECGADHFIRKPYEEGHLIARIEYLLKNTELRKTQKIQMGVEVELGGNKHFINSERIQILDMLISTYEQAVGLNTALQQRERELERTLTTLAYREEETRAVISNMVDGVITVDEEGGIRSVNAAVTHIFGHRAEDLVGRNIAVLAPKPYRSAADCGFESAWRPGQLRTLGVGREVQALTRSGERITVDLAISEYVIRGRRFVTGVLRDVRERVRVQAELEQARREAEQASQAKSAFLATMSHEIRTPMNGVIGMIDVLQETSLKGDQRQMVELIRDSAFSLLAIIEDILDFSKIEAGKLEIERAPMHLAEVLEHACDMMDRLAEKKQVELTLFIDPGIPASVLGDALRLRQVLVNLASNAIKFSGEKGGLGRVSVRAELGERGPDQVTVRLEVTDNGVGMDDATQARLFQAFAQGDISTTRRFGGTGLGLAITGRLVALMAGQIEVRSVPGVGSTFRVLLPLTPLAEPSDADAASQACAGLACLVLASGDRAADLVAYLESAGLRVAQATDPAGAMAQRDTLPPGLCIWVLDDRATPELERLATLLDARPDLDERFVRIRRGRHHRRRQPRQVAADRVEVDATLLTRGPLLQAVAMAAGRAVTVPPVPEDRGLKVSSPPSRATALGRDQLILVAEDNETNRIVIQQQLALLGYAADVAGDGRQALKRWRTGEYALLLTDLHMPELDGYELARAIRAEESGPRRRPIVALTANALKGEAEHCYAAGMDDYLAKPTPLADLEVLLRRWLPPAQALPGPSEAQPAPDPVAPAPADPVDVKVLQAFVGGDPGAVQRFLELFLESGVKTAQDLLRALAAGQAENVGLLAHKLKSSARVVGAMALGDLCAELEQAGRSGAVASLGPLRGRFERDWAAVEAFLRRPG